MTVPTKVSFPTIPEKNWWLIRKRFKETLPSSAPPSYLANLLGMSPKSATANILPALRTTGLLDENNAPTDRARRWRDDGQYSAVCAEIVQDVYPDELRELHDSPSANRAQVEQWFANAAGVGQVAARKMASLYLLLLNADPSKGESASSQPSRQKSTNKKKKSDSTAKDIPSNGHSTPEPILPSPSHVGEAMRIPTVHVDLQIHISPEASVDQIDKIFESMAKHLYKAGSS